MEVVENKIISLIKEPIEKRLLDIESFAKYLSIGKTQARKILKSPECQFSLQIGNRWYADIKLVDEWIDEKIKNK